ncbi:carbohydrate kinase family protein [Nocardioides panacisoli]|uniref:carbohydrate kinase family protein n=1 Tax=Nocardioides panacisoli TaxID=627624 RepID=UPI001C6311C4|nr:carbohydrate kinase family protein [Nocardioides panacisoli]QYJ04693.1 carbohydrate kinase family protein [Nocardioides panacisoli]
MVHSSGPLLVAGSVATDHLMTFGGKFADSLVPEQLDKLSVSFLVEDLEVRRGGVGANIAFGLARLGERPILVGAVGEDFADYRSWLERHGVDCSHVRVSESLHTARFVCTTDSAMAQFASFYPGAMSESRLMELAPIVAEVGEPSYVLVGADDPDGMLRHTDECRQRGYPFIADPSQQLAFSGGELIRGLVDGAAILFSNEYESHLITEKTGWSAEEVLDRVGYQVTTLGKDGVRITEKGQEPIELPAASGVRAVEPTGVGDAFRAGFLAAVSWGLSRERAAQTGCVLAAYVVETVGTQEYDYDPAKFVQRLRDSYGDAAAEEIGSHLS